MKTAIVYDKWLSTLGGGEVVAGNIARALADNGYQVTFVSGKKVPVSQIKNKLDLDLADIKFVEVWNDEQEIQKLTQKADLYVNSTFSDYTLGLAKKNIYYTFFPTTNGTTLSTKLKSNVLLPLIAKFYYPQEEINTQVKRKRINNNIGTLITKKPLKIAFYNLEAEKTYYLHCQIALEIFNKTNLENFNFKLEGADILEQKIICHHATNALSCTYKILTHKKTIYGCWQQRNQAPVYLIAPQINVSKLNLGLKSLMSEKIEGRLRAGMFEAIPLKMKKFKVLCDSNFARTWIKKYWQVNAKVLYPPVELMFDKYDLSQTVKKNYICSVGRFFTSGHGKKQEEMIAVFKKMCDDGLKGWELHLAGGLGSEPSSQAFAQQLQKEIVGYPIFLHFNCSRQEIEKLYLKSKIYWHATGLGEDERHFPIKMEHFGISPIEAISAGCTPMLYRGGGLPETIYNLEGDDSYLFATHDELQSKTMSLIADNPKSFLTSKRRKIMRELYSIKNFRKGFIELIK